MDVTLGVTGPVRPLPGSTELCCYRIVQEALTNAGRHARGSTVRVVVTYREETLSCLITNAAAPNQAGTAPARTAPAGSQPGRGFGLTGLRERVMMLGGAFEAGPGDHGGFTVRAVLPVPPPAGPAGLASPQAGR